jgi:hypothetical protein
MGKMILPAPVDRILFAAYLALLAGCQGTSAKEPISIRDYPVNSSSVPIDGSIKAGRIWIEGRDTNIVVVTDILNGKPCDQGYSHRLFGYHFAKRDSQWKNLWTIRDQASGCQDIQYFDSTLEISDVDGNGIAETLFFYSLFSDGTDPQNLKMMFHFNGAKMPIRGRIPVTEEDAAIYEMKMDPKLESAPTLARQYALTAWKGFLSKNFKENVPTATLK